MSFQPFPVANSVVLTGALSICGCVFQEVCCQDRRISYRGLADIPCTMAEEPDYILDFSSKAIGQGQPADSAASAPGDAPVEAVPDQQDAPAQPSHRKWIGVHFKCCDVYSRIWRNREGTAYAGYCPRCNRKIQAQIGPDGVSARFFTAG